MDFVKLLSAQFHCSEFWVPTFWNQGWMQHLFNTGCKVLYIKDTKTDRVHIRAQKSYRNQSPLGACPLNDRKAILKKWVFRICLNQFTVTTQTCFLLTSGGLVLATPTYQLRESDIPLPATAGGALGSERTLKHVLLKLVCSSNVRLWDEMIAVFDWSCFKWASGCRNAGALRGIYPLIWRQQMSQLSLDLGEAAWAPSC